ncbi:MAG: 1-acyl-sn-glycerol-3-phosphate acyltransferase [Actinomycetia bacterium]|nr:1-acyl-sn-glycerol-3-phosphate acyltransferase [Actinomycetes bacterium]
MSRGIGAPLFTHVLRTRLVGAEVIPPRGPGIIAANHLGGTDVVFVPALLDRPVSYPAKAELFEGKGLKWVLSAWLRSMGQVPLDRRGGRAGVDGLRPLVEVLERGGLVGIFPEGTRSPDGRLYRGHTGVARLALVTGAPVYPVGMSNTHLRPGFLGLPSLRTAKAVFGPPLDFSAWQGRGGEPEVLRRVTDDIMRAIQQITGQEYVDVYANRVKGGELTPDEVERHVLPHPGAGTPPGLSA